MANSAVTVAGPGSGRQPQATDGRFSGRRPLRRRAEAGQSAIIAVIVLFLLLFLGAAFIALIANNLRNTQRAAINSASGRFAEAGIHYLDQQLTNSPTGADWRPTPECPPSVDGSCAADPTTANTGTTGANPLKIQTSDPDYFYLQPYKYDTGRLAYIGGYTRVNFGGPTPTAAGGGGRALVRVTYRPDAYRPDGTLVTTPTSTANGAPSYTPDQLHKYIKIESVGRSGQINPQDPTTFGNTNAIAQRVELVAYKQIGLNEYVRQITNKDNKPDTFAIGSPTPVVDYDISDGNVVTPTSAQNPLPLRNIETLIDGPVRVNGNVAFYGVNRLYLNQNRNDALEVAGAISLNGVDPASTTAPAGGANGDPTQVYVYYTALGAPTTTYPSSTTSPNILPSTSTSFTTLGGLVRDNLRGNETNQIAYNTTAATNDSANSNLRSVGRTQPPLIDAATGPNGLTRYRALTRDSAPIGAGDTIDNALNTTAVTPVAGQLGWGQGMYIDNVNDLQSTSTTLYGSYTPRADWLNPAQNLGGFWQGDSVYTPPAVQITLYPRYMVIQRSATSQGPSYFYSPTTGLPLPQTEIVEYTGTGAPSAGFAQPVGQPGATAGVATVAYEGYPAYAPGNYKITQPGSTGGATTVNPSAYYGDNVVYAEGNVRIRGVVGGRDPETGNYYQRHLTVVSNGIIYVDGNLLRDNVQPTDTSTGAKEVSGKSSIALLAKSYITVNTTQFLSPDAKLFSPEPEDSSLPKVLHLNADPASQEQRFQLNLGPQDSNNTAPSYVSNTGNAAAGNVNNTTPLTFLFRHEAEPIASAGSTAAIRVGVNETVLGANFLDFGPLFANNPETSLLVLQNGTPTVNGNTAAGAVPIVVAPRYQDDTFAVDVTKLFGGGGSTPQPLLPASFAANASLIGQDNILRIDYSTDASNSTNDYLLSRFGVVPLDIRIEAMMYAQEGSFFIIPGPWFNPNPNDTVDFYVKNGRRNEEGVEDNTGATGTPTERVSPYFPFYQQPLDMRLTFYGEITENTPAEIGDESAWLQKFGWVPNYYGSSGFIGAGNDPRPTLAVGYPQYTGSNAISDASGKPYAARGAAHGPHGALSLPPDETAQFFSAANTGAGTGQGILYQFDSRAISPYSFAYGTKDNGAGSNPTPIRQDAYGNTLPLTPGLPVAPGLIFMGQDTNAPQ